MQMLLTDGIQKTVSRIHEKGNIWNDLIRIPDRSENQIGERGKC